MGVGEASHVQHSVVGLDVEEERRNHAHGFLGSARWGQCRSVETSSRWLRAEALGQLELPERRRQAIAEGWNDKYHAGWWHTTGTEQTLALSLALSAPLAG